jgi:hypothetical protein
MERTKKAIVGLVLTSLLAFSVVPYFNVRAQTCNPDALVPVKYGQRGSAVRNAQACLIKAGYSIPAGATGYYGVQTRNAVKKFYADWYGAWGGNTLGPKGVAELKSRLAKASGTPITNVQQQQQQQPTTAEEGFLTVEKDPAIFEVTLSEGETGKVVGLRFRADNGAVSVKSIFLRWGGSVAPYRVISALKVVDSQGNVLYQTNVGPNTFLQDSSLNYYLPISGLNINVPKNGYTSVFVEVTIGGTLPSTVNSLSFAVNPNDVRGKDGVGIDRFGPSSQLTWSATLSATLAGQGRFIGVLNPNTPQQQYIFGDPSDGRAQKVKVLSFDVAAKNNNLKVIKIEGFVTNTSTVQAVYLAQGNNIMDVRTPAASGVFTFDIASANFLIKKDEKVTFDLLVDLYAPRAPSIATFTVSVATTTGISNLGDIVSSATQVTSEMMRVTRLGPSFAVVEKTISVTRDQSNLLITTVQSVGFRVKVTAVGGTLYVPATNTVTITLETTSGITSTVSAAPTTVKVGTTVISASGGYYAVPEGATYEFEFRIAGQSFLGSQSVRARLSSFVFDNDPSVPGVMDDSSFLHNFSEFWTNWSN